MLKSRVAMNIVLTGFMGTGGKAPWAAKPPLCFAHSFYDVDKMIVKTRRINQSRIFLRRRARDMRLRELGNVSPAAPCCEKDYILIGHRRRHAFSVRKPSTFERGKSILVCINGTAGDDYRTIEVTITARPLLAGEDRIQKIETLIERARSSLLSVPHSDLDRWQIIVELQAKSSRKYCPVAPSL